MKMTTGAEKCQIATTAAIARSGIDNFLHDVEYKPLRARAGRWKLDVCALAELLGQKASTDTDYAVAQYRELIAEHGLKMFDREFCQTNDLMVQYNFAQKNSGLSWREMAERCDVVDEYDDIIRSRCAPRMLLQRPSTMPKNLTHDCQFNLIGCSG